jgi:hypothetical protein
MSKVIPSKVILSLFDYSGIWSQPYREAGYEVHQIDIKLGSDLFDFDYSSIPEVYGILAAPPCTNFALSGSKYFKKKDRTGETAESVKLIKKMMEVIDHYDTHFWVVENPMSRMHKLVPELGEVKYKFHPYHHGDPYQKTTWLWGNFNIPERHEVEPTHNRLNLVGGKSEETKEFRSSTPPGFSRDFFEANP